MRHADRLQTYGHQADQHAAREALVPSAYSSSAAIIAVLPRAAGHVDSLFQSTSMMTVCDSVLLLTPGLQLGTRHSRAVAAHAVETAVSAMREREVFLGFCVTPTAPSPYLDLYFN